MASKKSCPELKFQVNDIDNIYEYKEYDFFSEITWYLLENNKFSFIAVYINQSFPAQNLSINIIFN
tara:strand:+ start:459 stop:656 length:198 start_codon:yes stop_codon:yes gene_type:complete